MLIYKNIDIKNIKKYRYKYIYIYEFSEYTNLVKGVEIKLEDIIEKQVEVQ